MTPYISDHILLTLPDERNNITHEDILFTLVMDKVW